MAVSVDDLEYNEFYKVLQDRYIALYERAQEECWLVCIPQSSSLPPPSQLTPNFVEAHLLEPSKLYRDQFQSLVKGKRIPWKLSERTLQCMGKESVIDVEVLTEELAYNRHLHQYRMFIVDRPMVSGNHRQQSRDKGDSKVDLFVVRRTHSDHYNLLQCFENHRQVLTEVNNKVAKFSENYMILSGFLEEASQKIEALVKQSFYSFCSAHSHDHRLVDKRVQENAWTAIEDYVMCKLESKVYSTVCERHRHEDGRFRERCHNLLSSFTPTAVDLPADYSGPFPLTVQQLNRIHRVKSPVEKLYCMQDAMDSIQIDVRDQLKIKLRYGEPSPLPSDDLISLLATIIVQANPSNFPSDIYYTEMFQWSMSQSSAGKLSYVLVTMRAALEYVRSPDVDKYLPKGRPNVVSSLSLSSYSPTLHPSHIPSPPPNELSFETTLARLSQLKTQADKLDNPKPRPHPDKDDLGPFMSKLMQNDGIVSSKDF